MTGEAPARAVSIAVRLYGRALRLLPPTFRERFADELLACFARIATDAHRRRGTWWLAIVTLRSLADLGGQVLRRHRAGLRPPGVADVGRELPGAIRRLARRPSFALSCILTLSLALAASTAVFTLVHGVVLRPLPYPDAERIVVVDHGAAGLQRDRGLGIAYGFFRFYRDHLRSAQSIAMYTRFELTLTGEGDPVRLAGAGATPSLVGVLGVGPALGRWFDEREAAPGAPPTVVVSDGFWRDRLAADPAVIGRTIVLDGTRAEIIGVMPRGFAFPDPARSFWVPRVVPATGIGGWNDLAVARLAAGATATDLAREIEGVFGIIRESGEDPERVAMYLDEARVHPRIVSLKESLVGEVRATLWVLLGTVCMVLLIAIANVANLFLVRLEERQRDIAVRTALGATGGRLLAGFLTETALLVFAAGTVGLATARLAIGLLRDSAPVSIPRLHEVTLDAGVVTVALAAALVTTLLLAIVPAHRVIARRRSPGAMLVEVSTRGTASRSRARGRDVLMGAQVALALVLLVGSSLLLRSFRELRAVDLGFAEREALTFQIGLPGSRFPDRASARAFHEALLPRLEAIPGVRAVGAVGECLPLSGDVCWGDVLEAEGSAPPDGDVPIVTGMRVVTPGYFRSMGIPVRGRAFTGEDPRDGPPRVAIVSEATAAAHFPGEDPIGRRIRVSGGEAWYTIVGVARDVRALVGSDEHTRTLYLPLASAGTDGPPGARMRYVVAAAVPPTTLVPAVRAAVAEVDALIPVSEIRGLDEIVAEATAPTAFALVLTGLSAAIALLLGTVGVYAVVAYLVGGRTREIGVRMAMGAGAGQVQRMVLRQGGAVVLSGTVVGFVGAYALTRVMRGMLYGVSPTDPVSYAAVTVVLLAVAGLALWVPARRAARVDPLEALRAD